MKVPGSNVLRLAMGPIARQALLHRAFLSRTSNAAGDWESNYAPAVRIVGSLQPIDLKLYQQLGLDMSKTYANLYTSANVRSTDRDRSGDLLQSCGVWWQAESEQDWRAVDGWRKTLCVKVPGP